MSPHVMPRAIAAGAVIAAAGLVLLTRPSHDEPTLAGFDQSTAPAPLELAASDEAAPEPPLETAASAKLRELEAMSETFRNTTFLIAIRDAGFVCNQLLRVYGGGSDDAMGWIVTCSEMLAYSVGIASGGALRVEPTLQYFDSLTPVVPRDGGDAPAPVPRPGERRLPPR